MKMTKTEAQEIADSLRPCPFCGTKPTALIRGNGEKAPNPKARCLTEDCMGARLPVICLDIPSDVDAWNKRA